MTINKMMTSLPRGAVMRGIGAVVLASTLAACDLEIANPVRVEETNLDDHNLVEAFLRGTEGDFAHAASGQAGFGGMYMAGALMTDEWVHAGIMPGLRNYSDGTPINPDHQEVNEIWAHASQARYTAEETVARIERLIQRNADSADLVQTLTNQLATANLWAGFANRAMGDTFCNAVISENGQFGSLQPHTAYYQRALPYFTRAIELFTEGATGGEDALESQLWSSYGGRAQTYLGLRQYDQAAADAAMWTRNATFLPRHANWAGRPREWNFVFRSSLFAHREVTVWGTPWVSPLIAMNTQGTPTAPPGVGRNIQTTTTSAQGDPRLQYDTPAAPNNVGADGRRPFWRQRRYTVSSGQGVPVAHWREMKLIQAEHRLRNGDITGMLDMIDTVRRRWNADNSTATVTPIKPTIPAGVNADSAAWAILIRERGLVMWLEGRRLPDMRRWKEDPADMWSRRLLELPQGPFTVVRRATGATPAQDERRPVLDVQHDMCVPVSGHERRTNPNI